MPVRYKTFGQQEYAYKIWNEKDPLSGKWKQQSLYLGVVVDKDRGIYEKRRMLIPDEEYILDYGDCYYLSQFLQQETFLSVLKDVFGEYTDTLLSLVLFKLQGGSSMRHAQLWYQGNAANIIFKEASLSTQSVSNFLNTIGAEKLQRLFFKTYLKSICLDKSTLIIDSTGLPNQINMPITDWGYHDGGIEKETRLILALEKESKIPLYFRYVAGNIGDVSTLIVTISELKKLGVRPAVSIIDAGYCSEDNIKALYEGSVSFLTRMPAGRLIYQSLVEENGADIERLENAVVYGKRGLFISKKPIDLYNYPAFAYVVCDPVRRGAEISKKILSLEDDKEQLELQNCGLMVLVSDMDLDIKEVVPLYYARQAAEQLFGIAKDDLNILPLRI
ncbi:MAG: transposase, partial [Chloroflexi bacterium]|nr:transposase [Chloroflexota bacterium]